MPIAGAAHRTLSLLAVDISACYVWLHAKFQCGDVARVVVDLNAKTAKLRSSPAPNMTL